MTAIVRLTYMIHFCMEFPSEECMLFFLLHDISHFLYTCPMGIQDNIYIKHAVYVVTTFIISIKRFTYLFFCTQFLFYYSIEQP